MLSKGPTLVISSLIFTVGFPSTDESLMTMFSARLFSAPFDAFLKSFESDVPIPNEPVIMLMTYTVAIAWR